MALAVDAFCGDIGIDISDDSGRGMDIGHHGAILGEDPRTVNIDEFVGTWIPLLIAPCGPYTWLTALLGFGLFRVIDMWKPLGCRSMERFGNGWGVMLDDVLAGSYALIVLLVIKLVFFPDFTILPLHS